MQIEDGALPFGNAMMTTWICPKCHHEDITVLQENGELLALNPDAS